METMIGDVPGKVLGMLEDLTHKLRKGVLSPEELELFLKKKNPFALLSDILLDWQNFWERMGVHADLRKVKVPKKPKGFDRLLVNPMTPQKAYDLCLSKFKCWKYTSESLDKIISHEDRSAVGGAYAVWVRERVEADEENKNRPANDLAKINFSGITLTERLIYELKYFDETGNHLDVSNWTLCSGSRHSGGGVPLVHWGSGYSGMFVRYSRPADSHDFLRYRQTVS